jgi:hypothetical protein
MQHERKLKSFHQINEENMEFSDILCSTHDNLLKSGKSVINGLNCNIVMIQCIWMIWLIGALKIENYENGTNDFKLERTFCDIHVCECHQVTA